MLGKLVSCPSSVYAGRGNYDHGVQKTSLPKVRRRNDSDHGFSGTHTPWKGPGFVAPMLDKFLALMGVGFCLEFDYAVIRG